MGLPSEGWIVVGLEGKHSRSSVVMTQDCAEIGPLLRQPMGTPLAHPNPVAIPLTTH